MKKIFVVAGEQSGDRIAAWYITKCQQRGDILQATGIGGDAMVAAGVQLYDRYTQLNVIGLGELLRHLPCLYRYINRLVGHIVASNFDEIVLVDFPGFNLRLAKLLKRKQPSLRITYVSPPQLWVWGGWRVKRLQRDVDHVVVMYPFEVEWYAQRGVHAQWWGSPVYEAVAPFATGAAHKELVVALIPGSRTSELATLVPLFLSVAADLKRKYPAAQFVLPVAQAMSKERLYALAAEHRQTAMLDGVTLVTGEADKFSALARACVALTKPGTVTLELGLLQVPSIVAFKTSALTYVLAKQVVHVNAMALPNLLTGRPLFEEFIQGNCTREKLVAAMDAQIHQFLHDREAYEKRVKELAAVKDVLYYER